MDRCDTPLADSESLANALRAVAHAPPVEPGVVPLVAGQVVDGTFRIEEPIGSGGMGVVYRAWDLRLQRQVAIKLHTTRSEAARHRLIREARALARVAHPSVIGVHEVGTIGDRVFIAMEYVDGMDARTWLAARARSVREILDLFVRAGEGLAAAHAADLIHRDFKPSNVLVGRDGRVLVADFGLVRHADEPEEADVDEDVVEGETVTQTGAIVGTPAYMAPEQRARAPIDARVDQYAFCVALHEALTGERPKAGVGDEASTRARKSAVPRWVQPILQRGLMPDPEDRFPTMQALVDRLRVDPSRGRRRVVLAVGLGAAVVGTAVATWAATRTEPCRDVGRAIAQVWDPSVAEDVDAALRNTGSPLAPAASARVRTVLDDYATRWSTQRVEACTSTRVDGDQSEAMLDRRMSCLDRRKQELAAVVDVLQSADAAVVEHAVDALGALGSLDACADESALESEVAPPDDPATVRAVEDLRHELAKIDAQARAGRVREVHAQAESAVARARELAYRPLLADALITTALVHDESDAHDAAIAAYVESHRHAAAAGLARQAWHSATAVAPKIGRVASGTAEALRWLDVADGWGERLSRSLADRCATVRARASVLHHAGRYEDAASELESILDELEEAPGLELDRANTLIQLGMSLTQVPRLDEAFEATSRGLELIEATLGSKHPRVSDALRQLGYIDSSRGHFEEALTAVDRAWSIERELHGDDALPTVTARGERALALARIGRRSEAIAEYEAVLEILHALDPPEPAVTIVISMNFGAVLTEVGALDRAVELSRRTLALAIPTHGADSLIVAEVRLNLAAQLSTAEQYEPSVEQGLAAVDDLERHLGTEHPTVALCHLNLAIALSELGRFDEAYRHLDRAEAATEAREGKASTAYGLVLRTRASVLDVEGRLAEARDAFGRALDVFEHTLAPDDADLVHTKLRYGQLLGNTGQRRAAIETLRPALEVAERIEVSPVLRGQVLFQLAQFTWSDPSQREEALAMAAASIPLMAEVDPDQADKARRWLRAHR